MRSLGIIYANQVKLRYQSVSLVSPCHWSFRVYKMVHVVVSARKKHKPFSSCLIDHSSKKIKGNIHEVYLLFSEN